MMRYVACMVFLLLIAACDGNAPPEVCDAHHSVRLGDSTFCVVRNPVVIEEGFECPESSPVFMPVEEGGVCSPRGHEDEAEDAWLEWERINGDDEWVDDSHDLDAGADEGTGPDASPKPITLGTLDGPGACADPNDGDEMTVESATIDGDILTVSVSFSGGCKTHTVTACWINTGCGTSDPPQVGIALVHDANGDTCEAVVTQEYTYDLSPIRCGSDRVFVDLYRYGVSVEYVYPDGDG